MKTYHFFKNNINATLLTIIIALLGYINMNNQKAMDKLIRNTTIIKESDIEQAVLIILNKEDIKCLETDVKQMQQDYYNRKYLTSKD